MATRYDGPGGPLRGRTVASVVAGKAGRRASNGSARPGATASQDDAGRAEIDPAVAAAHAVPDATVARLAIYLRVLTDLRDDGVDTVSSEELALAAGVNSAKLRKDLSHLGSYGVRGVGYGVQTLVGQLADTLGLRENRAVVLIGVGNLGQALAGYGGFASHGFRIAALLDVDPNRVGMVLAGMTVQHVDALTEIVRSEDVSIAVIATPADVAQEIGDRLADAGVTAILNFAPTVLSVPESVNVRKVDLAAELQILSFHEHRKSHGPDAVHHALRARGNDGDIERVSS